MFHKELEIWVEEGKQIKLREEGLRIEEIKL